MTRIPDSITGDDGTDPSWPSLPTMPSAGLVAG
jgi:hypothetical protein